MQLSFEDREILLFALLDSLSPPGEDLSQNEWKKVWKAEVERRMEGIRNGTAKLLTWEEVEAQVKEHVRG